MDRQQAARYARWSAGVAVFLVAITAGVYLQRSWRAFVERRKAPPPVPSTVERQISALTFSKVEQDRTIFTVRASKSTEFKDSVEDLLEDVQITVFGVRGLRHDTIHTSQCRYSKDRGSIVCAGDVSIDLLSATDAERIARGEVAKAGHLRVETSGVSFGRESGKAATSQPVRFLFPGGDGQAVGVLYDSDEGLLRLDHDVRLHLTGATGPGPAGDLRLSGASLDYHSRKREMVLAGPVHADSQDCSLAGGELLLSLDEQNHARRMDLNAGPSGSSRPEVHCRRPSSPGRLSADSMSAQFDNRGLLSDLSGSGNVSAQLTAGGAETSLTAKAFDLAYSTDTGVPRKLAVSGGVSLDSRSTIANGSTMTRRLRTDSLSLTFAASRSSKSPLLESAETFAPATLDWEESAGSPSVIARSTRLSADQLRVNFQPESSARKVSPSSRMASADATGNVRLLRTLSGKPDQTAGARQATARFDASGDWSEITLKGDVRLREASRSAQAAKAVFNRGAQSAELTGQAVIADASMRTTARSITFLQPTGELRADGGVQSSDLAAGSGAVQFAAVPANLTAEHLLANLETGRAVYSGHARIWQGPSVLEADSIELQKKERQLVATGHVRAVFPEAAFSGGAAGKARSGVWRVQAASFTYHDAEGRARAEGQVVGQSAAQKIQCSVLELFFAPSANRSARQVESARASGGVLIEQGTRRGSAERGEYTAGDGKFVLSGGNPSLSDPQYGVTTGRQLTFFLANDTIIVESEKGSRTLTRHRVEK